MSSKNSTPKSMFEKVAAFLKLGPDGKLQSFYSRLQRTIEQDIKKLNTSRNIMVSNFQETTEQYQYDLQDATEAVDSAWMNVTPEQVATNELQASFMQVYLSGIAKAQAKVKSLEAMYQELTENHQKSLKEIDDKITTAEILLAGVTGESSEA